MIVLSVNEKYIHSILLYGIRARLLIFFSPPPSPSSPISFPATLLISLMATSENSQNPTVATVSQNSDTMSLDSNKLVNINMTNVTKLSSSNYLMWSRQVHALVDGYDLGSFLDGSAVTPPPTITVADTVSANPAYAIWKRQDKLLYSALLGAIVVTIQPLLSRATTAAEIWETLASTYAKPSRGHVKHILNQLKTWSKGTHSIDEYVQGLTTRFDQLALLGKIIDHEDQIDYVLQGLPEEYKSLVDQTESRDTPPSITELHEKLINHEAKLQTASNTSSLTPLPITANYTNNRNKPYNARGNQKQNQPWSNNRNYDQNRSHDQNRSSRPYLGRCQLCGTQGHSARRCPQLQTGSSSYHGLLPTPQTPTANWNPRANVATASP